MKATNNFLIVKNSMNEEKKTASGLVIQQANTTAENNGVIVSIGPDVQDKSLKEGDVVWFSTVECQIGDKSKHLIAIKDINIIAIGE